MKDEIKDESIRSEGTPTASGTKSFSNKLEPPASSAGQTRARTEHPSVIKKDKSDDPNTGSKSDPDGITVHQEPYSTPHPSIPRMRHPIASSGLPRRKGRAYAPSVTPQSERKALSPMSMGLVFLVVIVALFISTVFMDAKEWWQAVRHVENTPWMTTTNENERSDTPRDSILPPPELQFSSADVSASSQSSASHSGLPKVPMESNAADGSAMRLHDLPSESTWYCFTMEEYSMQFIASDRPNRDGEFFFRCGTRVVDLRTETRPAVLAACGGAKSEPFTDSPRPATPDPGAPARLPSFPALRVVLSGAERRWHLQHRRNPATQTIPLRRVNDDYCDCLDGTDELLTNACSMAGAGLPLAGRRWRPYLLATLPTPWDAAAPADRAREGPEGDARVDPTRRLARRSIELGGPVLPIPCRADPTMLLSPSVVGDGIVDCCDGSDEGLPGGAGPGRGHGSDGAAVEAAWRARRARVAASARLSGSDRAGGPPPFPGRAAYADRLHPYHVSAAAVLVEKGYAALFPCGVLHRLRLARAEGMRDWVARGHRTRRARVRQGWEALGRFLSRNRTHAMGRLTTALNESEELKKHIRDQMVARQALDPIQAGVPAERLERYAMLQEQIKYLRQEYLYLDTILTQRVFGNHYEYYPLYEKPLTIPAREVVRGDYSISSLWRRQQAARRMSATAITNPVTPLGKPLPPHVDNVTVVEFTFFSTRYLLAAQSMADDGEDPFLAEGPSRRPRDEEDPSKGSQSAPGASPEYLFFVLGHWQPFLTERGGARMGLVDPAGDVDLPRRALVRPFSTLHRGGGRLQWPIRGAGKSRFIEIPTEDEESGKKRILSAVNGNASKAIEIPVLYQTNSPDGVAVHVYSDGDLRCEADPLLNLKWNPEDDEGLDSNTGVDKKREHDNTRPHRSQTSLVSFVCHPEDEILRWALNGKCNQEIVVGTPSACTRWVLDEAERQVSIFKKVAQQYESES